MTALYGFAPPKMQLGKICRVEAWQKVRAAPPRKTQAMTNPTERRILRVLDHIHDHPAGDLSLDALADVAALSRFHWNRPFRAVTGGTASQAVRRC